MTTTERHHEGTGEETQSEPLGETAGEAPVAERIRERGDRLAEGEVETALRKLEARGELTDAQREAVRRMADAIVSSLLAAPARTIAAAEQADDERLRTAVELFDPENANS